MIAQKIAGLNLGSRNRAIPGFLNMDIGEHPGVDIVGDVADLSRFPDGSIPAIYASNILEHFPSIQTKAVLKEWCRVLEPGGIFYVSVPDFKRAVELYLRCGLNDWVVNFLWGDQGYKTAYHYAGFDSYRLTGLLMEAGFSEVSVVGQLPIGDKSDCSNNASTFDNKLVSLNMVARK